MISSRTMPWLLSTWVSTTFSLAAASKLGQPQPLSNFVSEVNNSAPQHTQRYLPASWWFQYSPVKGGSVPFSWVTWNCSGVSWSRHSSSDFWVLFGMVGG